MSSGHFPSCARAAPAFGVTNAALDRLGLPRVTHWDSEESNPFQRPRFRSVGAHERAPSLPSLPAGPRPPSDGLSPEISHSVPSTLPPVGARPAAVDHCVKWLEVDVEIEALDSRGEDEWM